MADAAATAPPPDTRGAKRGRGAPLRCVVCYEREIAIMASPCKCVCLCAECASKLVEAPCPRCRAPVTEWTRVYIAYHEDDDDDERAEPVTRAAAAAAAEAAAEAAAADAAPDPYRSAAKKASAALLALTDASPASQVIEALHSVSVVVLEASTSKRHPNDDENSYAAELLRTGGVRTVLYQLQRIADGDTLNASVATGLCAYGTRILDAVMLLPVEYSAQISTLRAAAGLLRLAKLCVKWPSTPQLIVVLNALVNLSISETIAGCLDARDTLERSERPFLLAELRDYVVARMDNEPLRKMYTCLLCVVVELHTNIATCDQHLLTLLNMRCWCDGTHDRVDREIVALYTLLSSPGSMQELLRPHGERLLAFACAVLRSKHSDYADRVAAAVLRIFVQQHVACRRPGACALRKARVQETLERALPHLNERAHKMLSDALDDLRKLECARPPAHGEGGVP
jgi:hypothetical protein